jgi:hypothetical protein
MQFVARSRAYIGVKKKKERLRIYKTSWVENKCGRDCTARHCRKGGGRRGKSVGKSQQQPTTDGINVGGGNNTSSLHKSTRQDEEEKN